MAKKNGGTPDGAPPVFIKAVFLQPLAIIYQVRAIPSTLRTTPVM